MQTHGSRAAGGRRHAGQWFKSSWSAGDADCVEVSFLPGGRVGVRDSKERDGAVLIFTASEFKAFIDGAKDGEFDQ